jgi:hypothetical protein
MEISFYDQLKSCWLTALIGFFLFISGSSVLFWNEVSILQEK